jgi:hypothetical protein
VAILSHDIPNTFMFICQTGHGLSQRVIIDPINHSAMQTTSLISYFRNILLAIALRFFQRVLTRRSERFFELSFKMSDRSQQFEE